MLRLHVNPFDYTILGIYFALVVTIGVMARRAVATSEDFLLSGRSLPAWVTGLAFISANLGAIEILGMAANGAQYGLPTVHFYWIGAVPAMVFLGIVMMPFYYGSRVRSVPEFLLRRFNPATHLFNALTFALAAVLIAGVNLFALALVIHTLIGWPTWLSIIVSALFVLAYITLGGLSGAIYNEVLQFFVIIAGLVPLVDHRAAQPSAGRAACRPRSITPSWAPAPSRAGAASGSGTGPTRSATGSASSSGSASSCRSATGPRTSPRSSAPCRPRTCPRPSGRR